MKYTNLILLAFALTSNYAICSLSNQPEDVDLYISKLDIDTVTAIRSLGFLGEKASKAIPHLAEFINDECPDIYDRNYNSGYHKCYEAIYALGKIGTPSVKALIGKLNTNNTRVVKAIVQTIGDIGEAASIAVPHLGIFVKEDCDDICYEAITTLSKIGEPAVNLLINKLSHKQLTDNIINALGSIGPDAYTAIPSLDIFINDDCDSSCFAAIDALEKIGNQSVNTLLKHINTKNKELLEYIVIAIGEIGKSSSEIRSQLSSLINNNCNKICFTAVEALGKLGKPSIKVLEENLNSKNDELLEHIIYAIGKIGKSASSTIPSLKTKLTSTNNIDIKNAIILAFGEIGPEAKLAVPELINLLDTPIYESSTFFNDSNNTLVNTINTLGKIGMAASPSLPKLAQLFYKHKENDNLCHLIIKNTNIILKDSLIKADKLPIPYIEKIIKYIETSFKDIKINPILKDIEITQVALANHIKLKKKSIKHKLKDWIYQNQLLFWLLVYISSLLSIWSIIFLLKPLWIFKVNESIKTYTEFQLPSWLGGMKIPFNLALLVGFFHYCPRVLDAWVKSYVSSARERFSRKNTVYDRKVYIPIPIEMDGNLSDSLTNEILSPKIRKKRFCLLISGEGGSGKTSLACQIAKSVMEEDKDKRPSNHIMLPILLEHELDVELSEESDTLLTVIGRQLQDLIESPIPISEKLLQYLLQHQRLLIIVDHFSEMTTESCKQFHPEIHNFSMNALIITSRNEENLGSCIKSVIKPLRVSGNHLSSFMEAYLTKRQKRSLFDDTSFFKYCSKLSAIISKREITVLLITLYAELIISKAEHNGESQLPESIPDLMLSYLNNINRNIHIKKLDDLTIHCDMKTIAWVSLKNNFQPSSPLIIDLLAEMEGENKQERLKYLAEQLRIIHFIQPAQKRIRIALDPLAEYLAGIKLVEILAEQENHWHTFFHDIDDKINARKHIYGFLLAVWDCCLASQEHISIPSFAYNELTLRVDRAAEIEKEH
ncbi:HEAT repeat domain-containing protein [Spartinivicinus poritis]|uniref:HEAT repeat domain-containing protein n=1 Tax=Spartinivicinus poritis TaxID=2994640 RepID=A0ABT5UDP5_9GAMM|nr:HEAT repeat domain-containing protein [Spartinivicinus sp. A2-2]MDE1464500.1 HEAT repeat domain-containing protein [Spartinivicinus sp. A2-2]